MDVDKAMERKNTVAGFGVEFLQKGLDATSCANLLSTWPVGIAAAIYWCFPLAAGGSRQED